MNSPSHPFHAWNTGREYTVHGQRIAATQITAPDHPHKGRVVFVDIDRALTYVTEATYKPHTGSYFEIKEFVMYMYDHHHVQSADWWPGMTREEAEDMASLIRMLKDAALGTPPLAPDSPSSSPQGDKA